MVTREAIFRAASAFAATIGVLACDTAPQSTSPRPPCVAEPCVPSPPPPLRRARLEYEVQGRSLTLPVVRGSIGGLPTLFLIDTGANTHALTRWAAKKAKIGLEDKGDSSTDHSGKAMTSLRAARPAIRIEGWGAIPDRETLVIDVPEGLEKLGIGGFLSPQRLPGTVVLDLLRGEMREGRDANEEKGALAEWASFSRPEPRSLPEAVACRDDTTPLGALSFVVPAKIEDQNVSLLVDTGAQRTDLFSGSTAGRAISPRAEAGNQVLLASGKVDTKLLRDGAVVVGDVRAKLDVGLLPGSADPLCPRDGVLAMDVLRRCVLVFADGTFHGRCLATDPPSR